MMEHDSRASVFQKSIQRLVEHDSEAGGLHKSIQRLVEHDSWASALTTLTGGLWQLKLQGKLRGPKTAKLISMSLTSMKEKGYVKGYERIFVPFSFCHFCSLLIHSNGFLVRFRFASWFRSLLVVFSFLPGYKGLSDNRGPGLWELLGANQRGASFPKSEKIWNMLCANRIYPVTAKDCCSM